MLHETSRRTALKLMAMGPVALTHPEALQALVFQSSSPDAASATPDTSPVPLDPAEFALDGRAEGEPDAFAMLNRINRLHGEMGTQMVEVDGVVTYTEVFPLGEHNVEVVSETSTMADGSPYQAGRISYIPDEEGDLSYTEFNFDSSGRVWVETPALHLSDIDLQSEGGVQYMIEALDWHEYAREFSPSTVWVGVDEAVRLLDEPDSSSTFVQDHIEPMVGWDEIDPINMRFSPEDYYTEITADSPVQTEEMELEGGSFDSEDERELDEAMASYQRGEFTRLTASDIRNRLTAIEEENNRAAEAMEKFQRGDGSVYAASDLDRIIALKKAKLSGGKSGFSRAQLFHAFAVLGGELKNILQGGTYTALPEEVRRILAGGQGAPSLEIDDSQVFELVAGEVISTQGDEIISISSGFSFYSPEDE